jgi:hypothetical protein
MVAMYGIELDTNGVYYDFSKVQFISFPVEGSDVEETETKVTLRCKTAALILLKRRANLQVIIFPMDRL